MEQPFHFSLYKKTLGFHSILVSNNFFFLDIELGTYYEFNNTYIVSQKKNQ